MDGELVKQALIQASTFLVFFMVIKKFFYDKINNILVERKEKVETDFENARLANEKALELEAEYSEKVSQIESERIDVLKKAAADAEIIKSGIVKEAREQASGIIVKAQDEITAERKKAEESLKDSIADLSIEAAQKVIGKTLNKQDHLKLIEESISMFKEV